MKFKKYDKVRVVNVLGQEDFDEEELESYMSTVGMEGEIIQISDPLGGDQDFNISVSILDKTLSYCKDELELIQKQNKNGANS